MTTAQVLVGWSCVGALVVGLSGCAAKPRERPREGGPVVATVWILPGF